MLFSVKVNSSSLITRKWSSLVRRLVNLNPAFLGLVTGLLPCMILWPSFASAAASQNVLAGAIIMLCFFLGTLPAMTIGPSLLTFGRNVISLDSKTTARLSGLLLIVVSAITMLRAFH
jgi:sulfite exporter TauE/SafE